MNNVEKGHIFMLTLTITMPVEYYCFAGDLIYHQQGKTGCKKDGLAWKN